MGAPITPLASPSVFALVRPPPTPSDGASDEGATADAHTPTARRKSVQLQCIQV